jgi:hypothetical protein
MTALTRHWSSTVRLSMPRCTGHGCRRESTYESHDGAGGARWHHSLLIDRSHMLIMSMMRTHDCACMTSEVTLTG